MRVSTTARHALLGALSLAVAGGVPLGLAAAPASAASSAVQAVACVGDLGGYSPYLKFGCGSLKVTVTDSTPSAAGDYKVSFNGTDLLTFAVLPDGDRVDLLTRAPAPADLVSGTTYPVTVSEGDAPASEPFGFLYDVVTAPAAAAPVLVDGGYRVGAASSVQLEGAWEVGSEVVTKVVANVGGTQQDAVSNSGTEIAIASAYDAATSAITFTVPASAAGRFIWVSVAATKADEVSSGFQLAPVKATGTPAYDPAWVRSPGSKTGIPKVGKRVGLSAPTFSSASVKAATTVRYRWLKDGKPIAGATRSSLALTKALRGKRVSVRVTFAAQGYQPLLRTVTFGRVR